MTDNKEISEAINVQELFEKSKIDFSKEYIENLQQSYDDGDLSLEELDDLIDSIKTVEKAFKKNNNIVIMANSMGHTRAKVSSIILR